MRHFGAQYTPHRIAVYASPRSSPPAPQHSLPGDALPSYPGRTRTGWNAPAAPGALKNASYGQITPDQPGSVVELARGGGHRTRVDRERWSAGCRGAAGASLLRAVHPPQSRWAHEWAQLRAAHHT